MLKKDHKYANKTKCNHLVQSHELYHHSLTKVVVVGETLVVLYWEGVEEMVCQVMMVG